MSFVYILQCNDNSFYTGWTNDLSKRLKTHNNGKASKYTRGRLPVKYIYIEKKEDRSSALKREFKIKQLTRKQKEKLINSNRNKISEYIKLQEENWKT